ncbi:hypothetical protein NQ318_018851 [Aromia moschata]|uniref:Uncharacterized protein n=1 Tax=Aromia moschata TaxID=1265417 RepID=A0AAV8ZGD3_9CUCU|nr:hypothetical protein NQ318_018851 [Aromia moschata]
MLSVQMEQRINLTFLVKLGKTCTEAYEMLNEEYGNECLYCTKRDVKRAKTIRAPDGPQRQKRTKTLKKTGKLIREDRRLSIRGLAEITGIDKECVRQILHESFNMRKVCTKMMPKVLTPEQIESRMNICADILNTIDTDSGLLDTVTLKGTKFESVEAVKAKATKVLNQLTEADFQHCFQ